MVYPQSVITGPNQPMGKGAPQTEAKLLAKKMKYGHLQKLKWYCEICQHQCNDEQSYRQHVQCEKHRLMMVHFRAHRGSILGSNSAVFERTFMDVLRRRFPNREVPANIVYTQVIRDKNHVHMNATYWESVHGFCIHLENHGKIKMRMTERGPMIRWVNPEEGEAPAPEPKREQEIVEALLQQAPPKREAEQEMESCEVEAQIVVEKKNRNPAIAAVFAAAARPKAQGSDK
jgi:DNA/RNA-binding protein KIN17